MAQTAGINTYKYVCLNVFVRFMKMIDLWLFAKHLYKSLIVNDIIELIL